MIKQVLNKEKLQVGKASFSTIASAVTSALCKSGVKVVYNYPGRPATYLVDAIKDKTDIDVQDYLPNEYVATGKGFGSSIAGQERSLVVFKDVGTNVASDHFYCLNHVGVNRGLVFFIADDPSSWHSQNEEDSRGIYWNAGLPILEPFDAVSSYYSVLIAYELSEMFRLPVFIRTTARALSEKFDKPEDGLKNVQIPFVKDFVDIPFDAKNKWLSIFSSVEEDKEELYEKQKELSKKFDEVNLNVIKRQGKIGIIASGYIAHQLETEDLVGQDMSLLKLATVYPIPEKTILSFVKDKEKILVIDQGEPLLEMLIRDFISRNGLNIPIYGKLNGYVRRVGEFRDDDLKISVSAFKINKPAKFPKHKNIAHAPAFEKDSKYRILVETLRDAIKEVGVRPFLTADAGQPSRIPDTPDLKDELHLETTMGGVVSILSGGIEGCLRKGEMPSFKGIAYVGDSDFFHSAFSGICEAATKDHPILMLLIDNQGAVSTGKQPHLGMKINSKIKVISYKKVLEAIGVDYIREANVDDINDLKKKLIEGLKSEHFFTVIVHIDN